MKSHSKTYEQYCWVKQKNIVMCETVFHNGKREVVCTDLAECNSCGGCKNRHLCLLWANDKNAENKSENADTE